MCNLYRITIGQAAIIEATRAMVDRTGNMPPLPGVFPDQMAPVVRSGPDGCELAMLRWGFPSQPGVPGNRPVTNIRNTKSSLWRAWMKPENRWLVPVTSFCEYAPGKPAVPHWFALGEGRPLFAFAGLWRPWTGTRGTKAEPIEGEHEVYAFLTTDANAVVAPSHLKAMPAILTTPEKCHAALNRGLRHFACWRVNRPLPSYSAAPTTLTLGPRTVLFLLCATPSSAQRLAISAPARRMTQTRINYSATPVPQPAGITARLRDPSASGSGAPSLPSVSRPSRGGIAR